MICLIMWLAYFRLFLATKDPMSKESKMVIAVLAESIAR